MAHEFAGSFQEIVGIGKLGATKETDIDVRAEGVDVGEGRITYARGHVHEAGGPSYHEFQP